jgi:hypothetical protein
LEEYDKKKEVKEKKETLVTEDKKKIEISTKFL